MGCGASKKSYIITDVNRHSIQHLIDTIIDISSNESFYRSLYNTELLVPFRRVKTFFENNIATIDRSRSVLTLPNNVVSDVERTYYIHNVYREAKEIVIKVNFILTIYLNNFFASLERKHEYYGLCDINSGTDHSLDLYQSGILSLLEFEKDIYSIQRINNSSRVVNKQKQIENIIKNKDLIKRQDSINTAINMIFYNHRYDGSKKSSISSMYTIQVEDQMPDSIKKRRLQQFLIKVVKCNRCKTSYYHLQKSVKRNSLIESTTINPLFVDDIREKY